MNEMARRLYPKLLFVIADKKESNKVTKIIKDADIHLHFQTRAEGTAKTEMLDLIGLGGTSKVMTICLASNEVSAELMHEIADELNLRSPGSGIAFTLPIAGAGVLLVRLLDEETREKIKKHMESEVEKMKYEVTHNLILAIINQGFSGELMDAAREAGATGGTVVHARSIAAEETMKIFGITIQEEKEIVFLLVPREQKVDIMKAIGHSCGLNTEAQGLVLALPVDSVVGLAK